MKIECKLKRQGGTKAELDGVQYHFEELTDGAHVANVESEAHIDRFLAIPEAYRVYHGKEDPTGKPQAVTKATLAAKVEEPKAAGMLEGSDSHPPQFDIGGKTYSLAEIVRKAFEASGLEDVEWNDLDDSDRAAKIDIVLDDLADAAEKAGAGDDAEREALVEQFKAKFGKAPHPSAKIETIKAKLAE